MDKQKMEEISFQIISTVGQAKALYCEAIDAATKNEISKARELLKQGTKELTKSHKFHHEVIIEEAQGNDLNLTLLFVHAEDQFITTDLLTTITEKMIDMCEAFNKHGK